MPDLPCDMPAVITLEHSKQVFLSFTQLALTFQVENSGLGLSFVRPRKVPDSTLWADGSFRQEQSIPIYYYVSDMADLRNMIVCVDRTLLVFFREPNMPPSELESKSVLNAEKAATSTLLEILSSPDRGIHS